MSDKMTVTPTKMQVGVYGRAEPDVPMELDVPLAEALVRTGNWVEGLTERAKAREAEAAKVAASKKRTAADKGKASEGAKG